MARGNILEKYYCRRTSLYDYISRESSNELSESISKFLKRIVICAKHDGSFLPRKPINKGVCSSTEDVLHLSISCILKRNTQNVLTQGIRFKSEFSTQVTLKGLPNVVMTTQNSSYNILKTITWENIHKLLGDDLFFYLLTATSIFIKLPKKCYFQLIGTPVSHVKLSECNNRNCLLEFQNNQINCQVSIPKVNGKNKNSSSFKRKRKIAKNDTDLPPAKKLRCKCALMEPLKFTNKAKSVKSQEKLQVNNPTVAKANDVNITYPIRSKIFYTTNLSEGFPKEHTFNTTQTSNSGILTLVSKIFNIKSNSKRTPKHLMPLSRVLKIIIKNFKKLQFHFSLNHHCPLPKWLKKSPRSKKSGQSKQATRRKDDCVLSIYENFRYKLAVQSYVPIQKVFLFLRFVLKKILRPLFDKCPENEKIFLIGLKRFVFLGRYEKLSIEKLVAIFKMSTFDWLTSSHGKLKHVQQQSRDLNIVKQLFLWLYNKLVIPLISSFFYATETGCHRNKVVYYRKSVWNVIQEIGFRSLTRETFKEVSPGIVKQYLNEKSCLGVYQLRFLPSISKIRPIANMSKCYTDLQKTQRVFINHILKPVLLSLRYEIERNPCLGATVSEANAVYNRVISFLSHVRTSYSTLPPFYMVTLDISRCFDSLPISKLFELIPSVLKERSYSVRKFTKVQVKDGNYSFKRLIEYGCDTFNCDNAVEFLKEKFSSKIIQCRDTIFIERPCATVYERDDLIALMEKHVKFSIGTYRGKYLLQKTGVPQGSILATFLNNFLLGHIERTDLHDVLVSPDCLLMRWIDDYFFVALSEDAAVKFIKTLSNALNRYGYCLNFDKSAVNFDADATGYRIQSVQNSIMAWCGYLVNTKTLEFSFNYTQYVGENLRDSMTIEQSRKQGQAMLRKLLLAVSVKARPLILDSAWNTMEKQHLNIYQVFRYIALRFYAHFKVLSKDSTLRHRLPFYLKVVEKVHEKFQRCITNNFLKSKHILTDESFVNSSSSFLQSLSARTKSKLDGELIQYLCYQAFIDVLETKKANLGKFVSMIKSRIKTLKRYDTIVDISSLRKESYVFTLIKTR